MRIHSLRLIVVLLLLWLLVWLPSASAHDGPEAVIEALNATMLKSGPTADLLFRRASEFRALRNDVRAANDLERAIELDGSMEIARLELARLQLKLQRQSADSSQPLLILGEPLETLKPLLDSPNDSLRIAAVALRGEIHLAYCQWDAAATDFSAALKSRPEEVQWSLWLAEALQRLGRYPECLTALRESYATTSSPVIRARLCDVLIENASKDLSGESPAAVFISEARAIIEHELSVSRLKSAWRIRHAELLLLTVEQNPKHREEARRELNAALEELNSRLSTNSPDPILVKDRERALAMLQ